MGGTKNRTKHRKKKVEVKKKCEQKMWMLQNK